MSDVKLSELIRKGAAMVEGRQAFGDYIKESEKGVCLCGIGAAYYALTGELPITVEREMYTDETPIRVLSRAGISRNNLEWVRELNDESNATFQDIIESLESIGR